MKGRLIFGAVAWLGCLAATQISAVALGMVEILFLLAPLVIVPMGLKLAATIAPRLGEAGMRWLEIAQPFAAACAAASFFFPAGSKAAGLAAVWAVFCAPVALAGLIFVIKARPRALPEWCVALGMAYLPVGGIAFFLSRAGIAPMGFQEPIVLLTGVHFHYTAFAAPVLAGAIGMFAYGGRRALHRVCAFGLLAGTPLLGIGFALWLPALKLAAVSMIVASVTGLAVLTLMLLGKVRREARALLAISGLAAPLGMVMAATYGLGEFVGRSFVGLAEMARYHGIANGIGFTLCGLLGWTLAVAKGLPKPEVRNVTGD